jgi:hypothetical protein
METIRLITVMETKPLMPVRLNPPAPAAAPTVAAAAAAVAAVKLT